MVQYQVDVRLEVLEQVEDTKDPEVLETLLQ
jgi:hypothetical protein